ncbi:AEC family transporter [Ligilactobacillus equi]|uniref:AEC family transporter n=1 Tax=Ligilactobacillus equi TaxID=137357 RepID=UPI002ED037AF
MYFLISFQQICIMFILMGIGFTCQRLKVLHEQTIKELTTILINVVSPCLIFNSFHQKMTTNLLQTFWWTILATVISFSVSVFLGKLLFSLPTFKENDRQGIYKFAVTYTNSGFMGIPLIQALISKQGTFFSVPFLVVNNIFLWTHGVSLFQKRKRFMLGETLRTILLNPNIIATIIGLLFFISGLNQALPVMVMKPIEYVATLNTPLSMIVIGANLATIKGKFYDDLEVWGLVFLRNLIFPLILVATLAFLPLSSTAFTAITVMISAPVAGLIVMLSLINNQPVDFASKVLCLSTVCSMISLPLMIMLANLIH